MYNKPSALYECLNPTLDRLIRQVPEAVPFLNPVDAVLLTIPDYHDIVKHPMDLSTIGTKLFLGQYEDGWKYVEDVWLMFENAWLYNRKTTCVYRYCSKLADLFKSIIDDPMKKLGYCCGQNYKFEPKVLFCNMKQECIIPKMASYWNYKDSYYLCKKCYSGVRSKVVVFQKSGETISLNKEDFKEKFNNVVNKEPFVKCFNCGIMCHKICVLFLECIWKEGFLCDFCLRKLEKTRAPNVFTSENLQKTELGTFIENRVNNFLKNKGCSSNVSIRLVYKAPKSFLVKKGAKARFVESGIWPEEFPYVVKTLLAFQQIDSKDVCFFAMFVQEYGSECPQPNTRRVYLSYLDSIHFFNPRELRTSVYYEILLGYLDFVKSLGFTTVTLWSCPSKDGEDYLFYSHPKEQKHPNIYRLIEWYKKMLDTAIKEGIVKSYKDIYSQTVEDNLKNASELPYFDGDFLPIILEKEISTLEGNKENDSCSLTKKTALSLMNKQDEGNIKESKDTGETPKYKKAKKRVKSPKLSFVPSVGDPLTDKILQFLSKFGEVFLIIHLNHNLNVSELSPTFDPDPWISSGILSSREIYLEYCREKDNEYSSLRRAKYSSMVLLYELHQENVDIIFCNHCRKNLETGFECTVCKDFDLCSDCYCLIGHNHKMEALRVNAESKSYYSRDDIIQIYISHLNMLDHLSFCNKDECTHPCKKMKGFMEHFKMCRKGRNDCSSCSKYFQLVLEHSKYCQNFKCLVHLCKDNRIAFLQASLKIQNNPDSATMFEVNRNGNDIYSNNTHMSSSLSSDSLNERTEIFPASELVQNTLSLNLVDHKTELSNKFSTNVKSIDPLENFTRYNLGEKRKTFHSKSRLNPRELNFSSNFVPFYDESDIKSAAVGSNQQFIQEISETSVNTSVYSKNTPQNIQASSNFCSSQFVDCRHVPFNRKYGQTSEISAYKSIDKTNYAEFLKSDRNLKISSIPSHTSSFENSPPSMETDNLIVLNTRQVISTSKGFKKRKIASKLNKKLMHLRVLPNEKISKHFTSVFSGSHSDCSSPQNLKNTKNLQTNTSKGTVPSVNSTERKYFPRVSTKKRICDYTKLGQRKKRKSLDSNKSDTNSSCLSATSIKNDASSETFAMSNNLMTKFVGISKRMRCGRNRKYKDLAKTRFEPSAFTISKRNENIVSETPKDVLSVNYCELSNEEDDNPICAATTLWTPDFQSRKLQINATSTVHSTASLEFSPSEISINQEDNTVSEASHKLFDFIESEDYASRSSLVQTSNTFQSNEGNYNTPTGTQFSQTNCKLSTELPLSTFTNLHSQNTFHFQNGNTISAISKSPTLYLNSKWATPKKIENARNEFPIYKKPSWFDNCGNQTSMANSTIGYSSSSTIHFRDKNTNKDFQNLMSYGYLNSGMKSETGFYSSLNETSFASINKSKEKPNSSEPVDYRNEKTFPFASPGNFSFSDMFTDANCNKQNVVNFDSNSNFSTKSSDTMLSFAVGNKSMLALHPTQNDKSCSERQLSFGDLANTHKSDASKQNHQHLDVLKGNSLQLTPIRQEPKSRTRN